MLFILSFCRNFLIILFGSFVHVTSKFMSLYTNIVHISQSKCNQTIKFIQKMRQGRLVSDLFNFIFKKSQCKAKASGLQFTFSIFWLLLTWHIYNKIKTNCIKLWTIDLEMLNFKFSEKCLQSVSSFLTTFCVWFFKKNIFLV